MVSVLGPLRQRNFALVWVGQFISVVGDYLLLVALPYYVYDRTGSALATGAMFMVQMVPRLVLASVAGVFVDRWDRRRTMVVSDVLRAAVLLMLLAARSPAQFWIVYLVALVQAIIGLFFGPAKNALIPHLVPQEQLAAANALNALNNSLGSMVGSGLPWRAFCCSIRPRQPVIQSTS